MFVAGLGAGITETMLVVNPTEVIKIRIQANVSNPKYMNAATTFYHIVKDEGIVALYKGVTLTAARQGAY